MAVKIAPDARRQFLNSSGVPYSGAKLFYYSAGSTTKQTTYTTSAGSTANTNPIILDASGRTPYGVWFTEGVTYKEVLAPSNDTDPPSSPIYTEDSISGVNDTNTTASEWVSSGLTPTYVSATQLTVPGDNTTELHVGRRVKLSVTAGTVYGRISVTAYTSLTTVTVVLDSGSIDSGLTSLDYSVLSSTNTSIPRLTDSQWDGIGVVTKGAAQTIDGVKTFSAANTHLGANTFSGNNVFSGNNTHSGVSTYTGNLVMSGKPVLYAGVSVVANATTSNIWTGNYVSLTGSAVTFTDFADAPQAGCQVELLCNHAHTFTHNANISIQGEQNFVAVVGDRVRVRATSTTAFSLEIIPLSPYASKAQMETMTNTDRIVTPGVVINHPGVAKAWVVFNGTGATGATSALASYGVSSITKNATGDYTINFSTAFSSANYAASGMVEDDNATNGSFLTRWSTSGRSTTGFQFKVLTDGGLIVDSAFISLTFHGDH